MLQGRVGAHKLGVVGSTIFRFIAISAAMLSPKIMKIGSRIKKLLQCKNKNGIVFLKHSVLLLLLLLLKHEQKVVFQYIK